jgi:hypothetical protein
MEWHEAHDEKRTIALCHLILGASQRASCPNGDVGDGKLADTENMNVDA